MRNFLWIFQVGLLVVCFASVINHYCLDGNSELFALTELLIPPSIFIFILQLLIMVRKPSINTKTTEIIMTPLPSLLILLGYQLVKW